MLNQEWKKFLIILPQYYSWNRHTQWFLNDNSIPHAVSYIVENFKTPFYAHEIMKPFKLWTPEPEKLLDNLDLGNGKAQEFRLIFQQIGDKYVPCTPWTLENLKKNYSSVEDRKQMDLCGLKIPGYT